MGRKGTQNRRRHAWSLLGLAVLMTGPLAACSTSMAQPRPSVPEITPAQEDKFAAFLRSFRTEALAEGIRPETYDRAMAGLEPVPRVETLNAEQPEFTRPVWAYLDSAVSERRIADGRTRLSDFSSTLTAVERRSGVPKEILAALWGIETNYGRIIGNFNLFGALATLAYDGPRASYARRELLSALKILEQESLQPSQMVSSWAGAIGQTQFIPSTFLQYAVDGDGDGRKDLWNSAADALASAANVLRDAGWDSGKDWGYEVVLPAEFAYEQADVDIVKPLDDWRRLGVQTASGEPLPSGDAQGAIYLPAGARGPAFLVLANFKVILRYNNATSYALAVCLLADELSGADGVKGSWPRDEQPLSREDRFAMQNGLTVLGYDPGPIDGVIGRQTRAALRAWQKARGIDADGYINKDMVERVRSEVEAGQASSN